VHSSVGLIHTTRSADWIVTSINRAEIIWSLCLSVNLWADYWRRNEPISLKLGVMTGHTNRNNWLTFGGAPVPDVHCGSLFHFPHHCGTRDLERFTSISHTGTPRPDFYDTWRNDWRRQCIKFTTFWEIWQTSGSGLIRQSVLEQCGWEGVDCDIKGKADHWADWQQCVSVTKTSVLLTVM